MGQKLFLAAFPPIGLAPGLVMIRLTSGRQWRRRIARCRPGLLHLLLAILGAPGGSGMQTSLDIRPHFAELVVSSAPGLAGRPR
jgi:hypothetical protein